MNEQVDLFDRHKDDPPNRWHPHYESLRDWLDAEAPPEQMQKLRNRSRYRKTKPTQAGADTPAVQS